MNHNLYMFGKSGIKGAPKQQFTDRFVENKTSIKP
jgi:hypothetical protein